MSDKFACSLVFQLSSSPNKERFTFYGGHMVSASVELANTGADIERDVFLPLFPEHPHLEARRDGIYLAYVQGTYEKDTEGDFVFSALNKDFEFTPLSVVPDEKNKQPYRAKEDET